MFKDFFLFTFELRASHPRILKSSRFLIHGWFQLHSCLAINPMGRALHPTRSKNVARKMSRPANCKRFLGSGFIGPKDSKRSNIHLQRWKNDHQDCVGYLSHTIEESFIFTYMYHKHQQDQGEYSIHGSYGYGSMVFSHLGDYGKMPP